MKLAHEFRVMCKHVHRTLYTRTESERVSERLGKRDNKRTTVSLDFHYRNSFFILWSVVAALAIVVSVIFNDSFALCVPFLCRRTVFFFIFFCFCMFMFCFCCGIVIDGIPFIRVIRLVYVFLSLSLALFFRLFFILFKQ